MTSTTPSHIVRPAKDLDEVLELYWPLMQELGWVRHLTTSKSANLTRT